MGPIQFYFSLSLTLCVIIEIARLIVTCFRKELKMLQSIELVVGFVICVCKEHRTKIEKKRIIKSPPELRFRIENTCFELKGKLHRLSGSLSHRHYMNFFVQSFNFFVNKKSQVAL